MSLSRKIAHNTLVQMIGKLISTALGLFSLALITRYLGQEGFGDYTTIITYLTIFAVIADFGLTLVTVQMISPLKDRLEESRILSNLFSFRLVSVLIFIALAPLVLMLMPYSQAVKVGVLIAAPYFIFPALIQVIVGLLQKKLSMDRAALAEVLSRIVLVIIVAAAWKYNWGLQGILLANVAAGAASFILHYLLAKKFASLSLRWDMVVWKEIIQRSWPLAITVILNLIYLRADIIFLSLFKGSAEVGLYGAAYKVVDVLTTLPFMFAGLILPILTTAWIEVRKEYFNQVMQRSFDFMAIIAIPLIIGGQLLAKPVMVAVAGSDFQDSGPVLGLLIVAVAAIFLGTMFSHAVIALDKQKKLIGFYAFTSLSSLAAYLILIPRFSYFGAAAVTIYSELLIAVFSAYCVFKYSRFFPSFKTVGKSLLASLVMGTAIYFSPIKANSTVFHLMLVIFLASIIYLLLLFVLKGIKLKDLRALSKKSSGSQTYGSGSI